MKYKSGYKYILAEQLIRQTNVKPENAIGIDRFIILRTDGVLILGKGYAWNGANCVPDTKENMEASLVHDALYQLMQEGVLSLSWKEKCDEELRDIMIEKGSNKIIASIFFWGVTTFGSYFIKYPDDILNA